MLELVANRPPSLDDNFPTNGLGPAALAVQATRAATRYYDTVPDGEPLFRIKYQLTQSHRDVRSASEVGVASLTIATG